MRRNLSIILDLAVMAAAGPVALLLRENFVIDPVKFASHMPYFIASIMLAYPMLRLFGVDRVLWRYSTTTDFMRLGLAMLLCILSATLISFVYNRLELISRSVPVIQMLLGVFGMISLRMVARSQAGTSTAPKPFESATRQHQRTLLLIGLNSLAELYVKAVNEFGEDRVRVAGIVDHSESIDGMRLQNLPVFGGDRSIQDVVHELAVHGVFVDGVVVTQPAHSLSEAARRDLDIFTKSSPLPVEFFADNIGIVNWAGHAEMPESAELPEATDIGEKVAFRFRPAELNEISSRPYWRMKRTLDVMLALALIVVLWPVALLVAIIVAIDVGRPVLFWQYRPGVGGRPFALYKFRTMQKARDRDGNLRPDSMRLSRVGSCLRRLRADELPQLWNILVGEMSFIGPRPLLPVDQSPDYAARLLVRPGLTGWGQIIGGRDISAADKAALDVWYVRNASFVLDLFIVKGTIEMVMKGEKVNRAAIDRAWQELRRNGICRRASVGTAPPASGTGQTT